MVAGWGQGGGRAGAGALGVVEGRKAAVGMYCMKEE